MLHTAIEILQTLTLAAVCTVLWVYRDRFFSELSTRNEVVTPRQYERLNGRLDLIERTITEDRCRHDRRFDEIHENMMQHAAHEHEFRRSILETEDVQTRTMKSVEAGVQALRREVAFVRGTMDKVECVDENGSATGCIFARAIADEKKSRPPTLDEEG